MKLIFSLLLLVALGSSAVVQLKTERRSVPLLRHNKARLRASGSTPLEASPFYSPMNVNITLGTPPQTLMLNVDTFGAYLLVYNSSCTNCTGKTPYIFNPAKSTTYSCYKQNNKCNQFGEDVFTMGGVSAAHQVFEMNADYMPEFGIVGGYMGLNLGTNFDKYPTPLSNLLPQMDAPVFTVYMNNQITNGKQNGLLTMGAVDANNCQAGNATKYAPLSAKNDWQVKLHKFAMGGYTSLVPEDVQMDTSTYEIYVPKPVFQHVLRETAATPSTVKDGYYVVDCSTRETLPPLVFTIGGNDFTIESKYYTTAPMKELNNQCGLALYPFTCGGCPSWVFGSVFFTPYCGIFDAGKLRMGFAPAKHS